MKSKTLLLSFYLFIFTLNANAARYALEQINENEISAINSSGTLVGSTASGLPFVWPRDADTQQYLEADKIILAIPAGASPQDVKVVGINNALESGDGETIVGTYKDELGRQQSVVWHKTTSSEASATSYQLTSGTVVSGAYSDTFLKDDNFHQHQATDGTLDLYYQFDLVSEGVPTSVTFTGYLTEVSSTVQLQAYNWVDLSWDALGFINGQSNKTPVTASFNLTINNVDKTSGNNTVQIRFYTPSTVPATTELGIDKLFTIVLATDVKPIYKVSKLQPHQWGPPFCSGNNESDYNVPECVNPNDANMIYRALKCGVNSNWQAGDRIVVDLDWPSTILDGNGNSIPNPTPPHCSASLPICDFKLAKMRFLTEVTQGDGAGTGELVETFNYLYNYDYLKLRCVTEHHAKIIRDAFACAEENASWDESDLRTPLTQCDVSSTASGINGDNLVTGTSIRKDGTTRPVFWIKKEEIDEDGNPIYNTGDLGAVREQDYLINGDPTSKTTAQKEREDIINRTRDKIYVASVKKDENDGFPPQFAFLNDTEIKTNSLIDLIKEDTALTEPHYKITFKQGYTQSIDKFRSAAMGFLKLNPDDTIDQPVYWPSISLSGLGDPMQLYSPEIIERRSTGCPKVVYKEFSNNVNPVAAAAGGMVGSYVDDDGVSHPIQWLPSLCKDENNFTIDEIAPKAISTLDSRNIGEARDLNSRENIGTTQITTTDTDSNPVEANVAYISDKVCGTQDLNELLSAPTVALNLTDAQHLSASSGPSPIVAKGYPTDSDIQQTYILSPDPVYVDLSVHIATDHDRLTVGDEHILTVTVQNEGPPAGKNVPPNYATCIKFRVTASVVSDKNLEPKTIDDIQNEKLGGLTFKGFEAKDNVICQSDPISMVCAIGKLQVGEFISVNILTEPRPLLADRTVRTSVVVGATELEWEDSDLNNFASTKTAVDREACFIATAAYGSYMAPEVKALRLFRDNVLRKTEWGRDLVNLYYDYSPPLANYISQHESLRQLTRWGLTPLVYSVNYPAYASIILLLALALLWRIKRRNKLS